MQLAPPAQAVAAIGPKMDAESPRRVERKDAVVGRRVEDRPAEAANEPGWAKDLYGNKRAPANGGPGGERWWPRPGQEFILVRETQHSGRLRAPRLMSSSGPGTYS